MIGDSLWTMTCLVCLCLPLASQGCKSRSTEIPDRRSLSRFPSLGVGIFPNFGRRKIADLYCCCDLDSCSNLSFEQLLLKLNHHLPIVVVIAPPPDEVPQVLLLRSIPYKINMQSSSRRLHGPLDPFTAELSQPASTTQPRIRVTILGTLHSPGAENHQRCATDTSLT